MWRESYQRRVVIKEEWSFVSGFTVLQQVMQDAFDQQGDNLLLWLCQKHRLFCSFSFCLFACLLLRCLFPCLKVHKKILANQNGLSAAAVLLWVKKSPLKTVSLIKHLVFVGVQVYFQGTEYFNQKPAKGIAFLQEQGLLSNPLDPVEVVTLLKENPRLDKKMIGEYIGSKKNKAVLEAFVKWVCVSVFDCLCFPVAAVAAFILFVSDKIIQKWWKSGQKENQYVITRSLKSWKPY